MTLIHNPMKRLFWFLSGIDVKDEFLLESGAYISERRKYTSIGLAMFTMTWLALLSFSYAFFQIFYPNLSPFELGSVFPWVLCVGLASLITLMFFNLQRFVLTISNSVLIRLDGSNKRFASGAVSLLLSAMMAIAVGVPLQTMILSPSIEVALHSQRVSYELRVDDYISSRSKELAQIFMQWEELHRNSAPKVNKLDLSPETGLHCTHDRPACVQELKSRIAKLTATLEDKAGMTLVQRLQAQYHKEMYLRQLIEVQEYLKMQQSVGFLNRSRVGFESESFFSWLIILSVMFLQATPGLVRMLSHPSAYDFAKIEGDRLAVAKQGIELEADHVFDTSNRKVPVDKFHQADLILKESVERIELEMEGSQQQLSREKKIKEDAVSDFQFSFNRHLKRDFDPYVG